MQTLAEYLKEEFEDLQESSNHKTFEVSGPDGKATVTANNEKMALRKGLRQLKIAKFARQDAERLLGSKKSKWTVTEVN